LDETRKFVPRIASQWCFHIKGLILTRVLSVSPHASENGQTREDSPQMADTTQIRALLVDDEPLARDMLREMLSDDPSVDIVGECLNGQEAVRAINAHAPDILFLDVQAPEMGGFEVLESIKTRRLPHVIFVTAYDQYAVRAFEVRSLNYLLKPFDRERFLASWRRARAHILHLKNGDLDQHIPALLDELRALSNREHRQDTHESFL
jgi:two-component system LytT family response regulator